MGSLTWNGGSGDWNVAANWTVISGTDTIPGAGDDVTINAGGTYDVTVPASQAVDNLTIDASGALVNVTGTLVTPGTLAVGGTLVGEAGSLDLDDGAVTFANNESLDNLTVFFIGLPGSNTTPFNVPAGATLTLGPHLLLAGDGTGTAVISGAGTLVNDGTITTPGFAATVTISPDLDNEGSINVGYILDLGQNFINNGQVGFTPTEAAATLKVQGDLTGSGTITLTPLGPFGVNLLVGGTIGAGEQIIGPPTGKFLLTAAAIDPGAVIANFGTGSAIDLTGLPFSTSLQTSFSGDSSDGTLTISSGGTAMAAIQLQGMPDLPIFSLTGDGGDPEGTDIAFTGDAPPCFVTGTRIRSERGEVAVEELRVGDRVLVVRAGGLLPIIWIGHRRMRADRHPRPWDVYPVRVAAGAFADFVPLRDLWLSPEHCVFLHGVLVPVRLLLNDRTIVQVPCTEVTYWHVELPSHDLMLCEGAWTESYLDMGNRAAFIGDDATVGSVLTLHPDFSRESWEARACQQQERGGPVVEAIRAAVNARAEARSKAA